MCLLGAGEAPVDDGVDVLAESVRADRGQPRNGPPTSSAPRGRSANPRSQHVLRPAVPHRGSDVPARERWWRGRCRPENARTSWTTNRDENEAVGTEDITRFGASVLLVSIAVLVALTGNRISRAVHIPAPALFLVAAALASDIWPALGRLSADMDSRIVTVTLVIILFDGGITLGWRRLRPAVGAVLWLGLAGTVVTAAGGGGGAAGVFGFSWGAAPPARPPLG